MAGWQHKCFPVRLCKYVQKYFGRVNPSLERATIGNYKAQKATARTELSVALPDQKNHAALSSSQIKTNQHLSSGFIFTSMRQSWMYLFFS